MSWEGPFAHAGPRWFTIPAHRPFLDALARGLHAALSPQGPDALADALVLVPTRRGARALADAFVRTGDKSAVLLPQIRAIGDLDEGEPPFEPGALSLELPPAISPLRRRFELARLILDHAALGRSLDAASALEMADALGSFLDSVEIEAPDYSDDGPPTLAERIEGLVDADFAQHWRRSAAFLAIATQRWPERLAELGLVDPAARRIKLLKLLAEQWSLHPPQTPLIAAGSTGTTPATAELLNIIAKAPNGCVVLPGLDESFADDAWAQVDEQHPQGALKRLLDRHGIARASVLTWNPADGYADAVRGRTRQRVINEALRPAEATADWRNQIIELRKGGEGHGVDPIAEGLEGLSVVTARNEEQAATMAALLLREALETPDQTCALVTPDQAFARRVSAKLSRWGVEADSSAGSPLSGFPVGVLTGLLTDALIDPTTPATLLGLLKHPFVRLGREDEDLARDRTTFERYGLRGARPQNWDALKQTLIARGVDPKTGAVRSWREGALALARDLESALAIAAAPFIAGDATIGDAARVLAQSLETLCAAPDGSAGSLWSGGAGETAAELIANLMDDTGVLPPVDAPGFAALIQTLFEGAAVRVGGASHPRLRILGAIEARLVRADRMVLAGLEEGVWPQAAPIDPFLSRPMRKALKLPPPERRIGLAAHDFAQAACAPSVVLLNTERRAGQPTVPSRWLWRLNTLARGAGVKLPVDERVGAWAKMLDAPASMTPRYAPRPAPRPPVSARPRKLAVTRIETWVRDPYAIYARYVLGLRVLDRPDAPMEARARGVAIHSALERLAVEHPVELPENAESIVAVMMIESLTAAGFHGAALARERPLAVVAARYVVSFERLRRTADLTILPEQQGALAIRAPFAPFTVEARADRLEINDGRAKVLDFKTGRAPSQKEVESGFAPQLTLTGGILMKGGFENAGAVEPSHLVYVRVTGRRYGGEEIERAGPGEAAILAEEALARLGEYVTRFDDEATPYISWSAPQFMSQYGGDYDHLARVWEWAVVGDSDSGSGSE